MPSNLHAWIGTASAAKVGKMQYSCFSFNVYIQREAVTGFSCSGGLQCHGPSLKNRLSTSCCHCITNSLELEGAGVSSSEHPAYLAPALCMFCLLSVVLSASPRRSQLDF
jgi:hypothetical protein